MPPLAHDDGDEWGGQGSLPRRSGLIRQSCLDQLWRALRYALRRLRSRLKRCDSSWEWVRLLQPYGSSFASPIVGSASHATHPVLAEAEGSIRGLASWTPPHNGDSGLCISPGPLEGPPLAKAGHDLRLGAQMEDHYRLYAFPPIALLPQVLRWVREQRHKLIIIAPLWMNQAWVSALFQLLEAAPWPIPLRRDHHSQANGIHGPSYGPCMCGRSTGAFRPPRACLKHDGRS